jgi:hypothetical protein
LKIGRKWDYERGGVDGEARRGRIFAEICNRGATKPAAPPRRKTTRNIFKTGSKGNFTKFHQTLAESKNDVTYKCATSMLIRIIALCFFLTVRALAQTNNIPAANPPANGTPSQSNQNTSVDIRAIRTDCIQHRRVICGKILQILPDGLVVDSGYTNLMRPPLNLSWVVSGTVTSSRATNLVEGNQPESVCLGQVFLTDLPKKPVPKLYDYVNLVGYPSGQRTYTSVGDVQHTVRRFSAKLTKSVQWKFEDSQKQNSALK